MIYFYKKHNQKFGPYSAEEIVNLIDESTLVCNVESEVNNWLPASRYSELLPLFAQKGKVENEKRLEGNSAPAFVIDERNSKKTDYSNLVIIAIVGVFIIGVIFSIVHNGKVESDSSRADSSGILAPAVSAPPSYYSDSDRVDTGRWPNSDESSPLNRSTLK